MNEADVGALLRETVTVVVKLGGPPLAAALAVGILMSLVQVITQINEPTLSFVPKVAAIVGTLLAMGAFLQTSLEDFARLLFDRLVAVGAS